jgi:ABC-type sugar transport system ATPase subunit
MAAADLELIGELVEHGVAILLISSEMPELLGLSDRVADSMAICREPR